ncbi:SIMPL domain-containing protein [Methylolobus aquaticus]
MFWGKRHDRANRLWNGVVAATAPDLPAVAPGTPSPGYLIRGEPGGQPSSSVSDGLAAWPATVLRVADVSLRHGVSLRRLGWALFIALGDRGSECAEKREGALSYGHAELRASASAEAPNDMLVALLFCKLEGPVAAPLANEVNQSVAKALQGAQRVPGISAQTLDYRSEVIYQKARVSGWRVRQSLRLECRDGALLGSLLGELQRNLSLESIAYQVSQERMREVDDSLVATALKAFQQRADLVTRELGRSGYRIVTLQVDAGDSSPLPVYARASNDHGGGCPPPRSGRSRSTGSSSYRIPEPSGASHLPSSTGALFTLRPRAAR